jgi:hypothetical protein
VVVFVTPRSEPVEEGTRPVSALLGIAHRFIIRDTALAKQASGEVDV